VRLLRASSGRGLQPRELLPPASLREGGSSQTDKRLSTIKPEPSSWRRAWVVRSN
jgi:hypothetical protein